MSVRKLAAACLVSVLGCATAAPPEMVIESDVTVAIANQEDSPSAVVVLERCLLSASGRVGEHEREYTCIINNRTESSPRCVVWVECVLGRYFLPSDVQGYSEHEITVSPGPASFSDTVVCNGSGVRVIRYGMTCGN